MDIIQILIILVLGFLGWVTPVTTAGQPSAPDPLYMLPTATPIPADPLSVNPTVTPASPEATMQIVPTVVEGVEVLLLESFPVQITLHVTGYQPDGCDLPVQVVQARNGTTIDVQIYREVPLDTMCPMSLVPYDESIRLDGNFPPDLYTITVNGVTTEVQT